MFKWLKKSTAKLTSSIMFLFKNQGDIKGNRTYCVPLTTRWDLHLPVVEQRASDSLSPIQASMNKKCISNMLGTQGEGEIIIIIHTKVASAYFLNWYCFVPSGTSLRGLKVRVFPLCSSRKFLIRLISSKWRTGQKMKTSLSLVGAETEAKRSEMASVIWRLQLRSLPQTSKTGNLKLICIQSRTHNVRS